MAVEDDEICLVDIIADFEDFAGWRGDICAVAQIAQRDRIADASIKFISANGFFKQTGRQKRVVIGAVDVEIFAGINIADDQRRGGTGAGKSKPVSTAAIAGNGMVASRHALSG